MSEMETQVGASGEGEGGTPPVSTPSGESGAVTPGADSFAQERAQLEAQRAEWQSKYDRLLAETQRQAPAPAAPVAPEPVDVKSVLREELRRIRSIDEAVASLRQEFPGATDVFNRVDEFDSVEQLRVAAENSHRRFSEQMAPHVEAAVKAAVAPYVEKFGPLQAPPTGGAPGEGNGLPTWEEVNRMSMSELKALNDAHPGLYDRLFAEQMLRS